MDYSTLDKRRWACERELAVNKGNAPDLYLGAVPISQDGSILKFGGGGTIIEWRFICGVSMKTAHWIVWPGETNSLLKSLRNLLALPPRRTRARRLPRE